MPSDQIFFASIPPYKSRSKLSPPTVDRCLTHWTAALHTLRQLPDPSFKQQITPTSSFAKFLSSYILNDDLSHNDADDWVYPSSTTGQNSTEAITTKTKYINRSLRLCLKRAIKLGVFDDIIPSSHSYIKLAALFFIEGGSKPLLRSIWTYKQSILVDATKDHLKYLSTTLQDLASGKEAPGSQHISLLQEFCYFIMAIPEVSYEILAEEMVFEDLAATYFSLSSQKKDVVTALLEEIRRLQFTILMASTQTDPKRYSTLIDFLFNFIADADINVPRNSYITAIISQTPLLDRLASIDAEGYTNRWSTILTKLQNFESPTSTSSKRIPKLPRRKQKLKKNLIDPSTIDISQKVLELSELFPTTEKSILEATLVSVNYDLEAATMSLLDNSFPESTSAPPPTYTEFTPQPLPESTDELDTLAVPTSRLYMGKRDISGTADNLLKDRTSAPSKSQILAALQAFDSDDDERDDTYDQEDVGTVDPTAGDSEANGNNIAPGGVEEKALYKAFVGNPGVFARDAKTRRGVERKELREVTGMSDEAIEGWKIMLDRDGKRLRQLEIRFSRESEGGSSGQSMVQRTAYRKGDEDEEEGEGSGAGGGGRGGGGHRGRGGRRFAGPNDRNVTGQQRDHAAVASDGKEPYVGKKTSKARGEHNRKMQSAARDRQRTKKMGKGMGGGV
ncbi:hypothetical protein TWF281_011500 [Arthrobotrys megalospora]